MISHASAVALLLFSAVASAAPLFGTVSRVSYTPGNSWYAPPSGVGSQQSGGYQCFRGDVSSYPGIDKWVSFDHMWQINRALILSFSPIERARDIYYAIKGVAVESNIDPRLVLAVVMQESSGNPQVPCTGNGNCGLMQAAKGSVSYDPSDATGSIKQMILDGVQGTPQGPGLVQYMLNDASLAYTNNKWSLNPFTASRCYNSGSISASGNLDEAQYGVRSYANDIANRLLGWDGLEAGAAHAQCGLGQ